MIDFILGALLVALIVRGWLRGFVREAIGVGVLLVGTILAFRLSEPAGAVVSAMAGSSHDVSRYAGGVVVFLLIAVGGAVVSYLAHRGVRALPGLPTMNRVGGALLGATAGVVAATVAFSALAVAAPAAAVTSSIEASSLGGALVDPAGPAQAALGALAGDTVIATVMRLKSAVGEQRFATDSRAELALPATERGELARAAGVEARLLDMLNRSRVGADSGPVARSTTLDDAAAAEARKLYVRAGRRARSAEAILVSMGVPVVDAAELIALGASPGSVHQGIVEEAAVHDTILDPRYSKAGIATYRGPYGLLTVVFLAS